MTGECFDVIISYPPYIAANSDYLNRGDLRFEPQTALLSGDDGLNAIRIIVAQARKHLRVGGWLLLEHGYDQGPAVMALLARAGFTEISNHHDAAGLSRVGCAAQPTLQN